MKDLLRELVFIELPGHGSKKEDITEPYSIPSLAQSISNELEEMSIQEYDLIGHSMGGYVALELAAMPSFTGKLILLNSTYKSDSDEKKRDRERVAKIVETDKSHFVRETLPALFLNPSEHEAVIGELKKDALGIQSTSIAKASIAMKNRNNTIETVKKLGKRCVFILGKDDKAVSLDSILADADQFPEAGMYILENSGHMSHIEKSEEVMLILSNELR